MILSLVAVAALQTLTLPPSDDVWVYPHAADPARDSALRVWGVGGRAVPADVSEAGEYSMSYLKFSLSGLPEAKLTGAKLVLTHTPNPGYTLDQARKAPLEARALPASFTEKTWSYEGLSKLLPSAKEDALYGTGSPETLAGETVTISIDLLKGKGGFAEAVKAALASPEKEIAIALTSTIDMMALGRAGVYKVYSKDERDEKVRPKLVLTFG